MTAASAPLPTSTAADAGSGSRAGAIGRAGLVSGVIAAAATTVVAYGAKAAGVEMMAAPQTASAGEAIPMWGFALSTLMSTAIGVVLAIALARWAKRPAATFIAVTVALTVLSFAGPITTGFATVGTRLVLEVTHVVAAAIVIPALARCLPATRAAR